MAVLPRNLIQERNEMTFFALEEKLNQILDKVEGKDKWYTTKQAVDYCGLSEKALKGARTVGVLKSRAATGKILYLKSDIDAWLKSR